MYRSKLHKVLTLRKHQQGSAAEVLANARDQVSTAEAALNDVETVQQEYWLKKPPNDARLLASQANFFRQLGQVVQAQREQVSHLQTNLQRAQAEFVKKRADFELLANLIEKRERVHNRDEQKRQIRAQVPVRSTKL